MIEKTIISEAELVAITEAIYKRTGIDFSSYETSSLKRGFARLIQKTKTESMIGLWSKIMREPEIIPSLVDDLTVNLTELFRNEEAWDKISNELLPKIEHFPLIKILHAACSSGEEVYSMSMILHEKKLLNRSKLTAVDLSESMIKKAKEGKVTELQMKKYALAAQKHFKKDDISDFLELKEDSFAYVRPELKRNISFSTMNLIGDEFKEKDYHIIFCRNVMIYFDDGLKVKI